MNKSRKIAVDILDQILNKGGYSNIVMGIELNKSELEPKDKALVTEIVYGTIKYKYTIDKILSYFLKKGLKNVDSKVLNILRITIYQIKYLDKIPSFAAVNEAVELTKKYCSMGESKLVNGVLRNYLRNENTVFYNEKSLIDTLAFNYSFENWFIKIILKQYGQDTAEKIFKGLNETPAVTVRVNSLKGSYDEVWSKLEELGYAVEEGYACPEAITIRKGRNIEKNPLFVEGYVTVQDESAMLVAPSMEVNSEDTVLDLCSAPGGKTTHMAEIMGGKGKVLAFDIHKNKLNLIMENAKRLGLENIECRQGDATKYIDELKATGNKVLIDVPCSGFGIIRKKPEIKYTKNEAETKQIVAIQKNIIKNAVKYVKSGGTLLYSTCTLNKDENERNVQWLLKNFPEFSVEPLYFGKLENIVYHSEGYATILPNEHMDGFFIAKLKKC